jgi:hypothetical protein
MSYELVHPLVLTQLTAFHPYELELNSRVDNYMCLVYNIIRNIRSSFTRNPLVLRADQWHTR